MKPPKLNITVDEAVKRIRGLRRDPAGSPKGIPAPRDNANDADAIPGAYNGEGLSDPGYRGWVTGSGFGSEMW